MITIWKQNIHPSIDVIKLPEGAEILSVHPQREHVAMWFKCDDSKPTVSRHFRVYGTGHQLDDFPMEHIGTFLLEGGNLVFHLFEVFPK